LPASRIGSELSWPVGYREEGPSSGLWHVLFDYIYIIVRRRRKRRRRSGI